MKADPTDQLRLLEVQRLDTRTDQLRHQRAGLPELAEITGLERTRIEVDGQRRDQQTVVDDLTSTLRKAEIDVEAVRTRRTRDQDRMAQGLITNPRDLERMQGELASLERRISTLEDEELEVMEQLEEASELLSGHTGGLTQITDRIGELTTARDERFAAIDAELASVAAERATTVEPMPADLMALYEKLRAAKGGVGASELRQRQCNGCSMALDNVELSQFRTAAPDEVLRHEECSRILVRTPESGLGTPAGG